jgi:hypothetical protein
MKRSAGPVLRALAVSALVVTAGCASAPTSERSVSRPPGPHVITLNPAVEDRILALDPQNISEYDVRHTLAMGPAPRIVLMYGSLYAARWMMDSFAAFLEGMGYPTGKLRNAEGDYSQTPYQSSERLAGEIAWYYEHDGVRPIMIGHSQGGMQVVKVLYQLAGEFERDIEVWNPTSNRSERRFTIVDPLTGATRPVVGISLSYAAAVGAGGAAFMLPNQWNMVRRLYTIPNTVDEFTGFSIRGDTIAFTMPAASTGEYKSAGVAKVRNVLLPITYNHVTVPITQSLANDARTRDWINRYVPGEGVPEVPDGVRSFNVLWAADVWFSIKKHWCLEAQQLIRASRAARERTTVNAAVSSQ